ncbi:zinc finger protein 14 [Cricetulus griseus]|uniref:Zinc finger protein 14 n=2 Tax=Cricetulus griseus TaxID=10029 RepID=A0A061I3G9_CRIGR|nr:zinc finger protein 14 [Cricetulus griseus]
MDPLFSMVSTNIQLSFGTDGTQVIKEDYGYGCDHKCDKTQEHITDNVINKDMPPGERLCQSPLHNDEGVHKQVKKLVCKFGEESFIAPNDLNNHEKSYIGQKRYNCRQCGKTFKNAKCFEKHKVTHTKENPYVYKICQETFTCSSHLKKHERVHTGEKPYACRHCGKSFTISSYLNTHQRIHNGEKPYVCRHSGKAFNRSSHLNRHERIHSGEKPYVCRHCRKAFRQYNGHIIKGLTLKRSHIHVHIVEKPSVTSVVLTLMKGSTLYRSNISPIPDHITKRNELSNQEHGYSQPASRKPFLVCQDLFWATLCSADSGALQEDTEPSQKHEMEPVTFEDVAVDFTVGEWALLDSTQKKLYSTVMEETFLNLISIGKALKENIEEDRKELSGNMGAQVTEKACGYECASRCNTNQKPITENSINEDMPPTIRVHGSPLHVRNIISHSSSRGCFREQTREIQSVCKEAMAKALTHQIHWKDIRHSESLLVLETSPKEKTCKSQQCNEAYRNLPSEHPQERSHTRDKLNENVLVRYTYGQNDGLHKEVKPFVGKLYEKSEINSTSIINHEKNHIGEKRYICSQRGKTFNYAKCLENHIVTHKGEKLYACKHFGKAFTQYSYHNSNESSRMGQNPYTCKYCGKGFTSSTYRNIHERIHTGEKPYACKYCGKAFTSSAYCNIHERIHSGEKPYACTHCGKAFSDLSRRNRHERSHTGENPYACRYCGKAFSDSSRRNRHERIHTGEKPYTCKHCGKTFTNFSSCKAHERVHTGEKPYACKICGKAFTRSNQLSIHERVHSGQKPYACKHCGKTFKTSTCRNLHEKIHTGEKSFVCKTCGKLFIQSSDLNKHERVHSKDKPYACKHCGKFFSDSSSRYRHERRHTGEKPFAYKHC